MTQTVPPGAAMLLDFIREAEVGSKGRGVLRRDLPT